MEPHSGAFHQPLLGGLEDIENVEYVFKDGKGYDPKKLIDSVKGLVGSC